MRTEKENIWLDATVVGVIKTSGFVAGLANGHRLVAWMKAHGEEQGLKIRAGDSVVVELRPGDMEQGRIVASGPCGCGSGCCRGKTRDESS